MLKQNMKETSQGDVADIHFYVSVLGYQFPFYEASCSFRIWFPKDNGRVGGNQDLERHLIRGGGGVTNGKVSKLKLVDVDARFIRLLTPIKW